MPKIAFLDVPQLTLLALWEGLTFETKVADSASITFAPFVLFCMGRTDD
jgi:hypothetical protein